LVCGRANVPVLVVVDATTAVVLPAAFFSIVFGAAIALLCAVQVGAVVVAVPWARTRARSAAVVKHT
jgi:hypothetical protein